ncbi:Enoyl-CoA hydratase-like protein [Novymonas esmeraldas]|uniref:Enoyl-CoA hydratase-like protein n=1 Tax=Novymonas esmeraldas TaxID=1808958 RepID=A0AAW0EWU1_9TRYP
MLRRRVCSAEVLVGSAAGPSPSPHSPATEAQRRPIKTLDVREYRPLGTPIEFRFYQRYANHPNRQSGVQFLTHYNTHQRFRVKKDFIDYMHWGKEQGQARLPHRHQRVAFDFDDTLQPTRAESNTSAWFAGQDPTMDAHPDISTTFDPNRKTFSHPEHWNKMFSKRRAGEGDIKLDVLPSTSLLGPMVTHTDTQETAYFKGETRGPTHGRVPGINAPFQGEMDRKMMQAMSRPLNSSRTLTGNDGRFSKTLYINDPKRHQALSAPLAKELDREVDRATNGLYSKLTVLTSAQSGQTDFFCSGVDRESVGFDIAMARLLRAQAAELTAPPSEAAAATAAAPRRTRAEAKAQELLRDAERYEERADAVMRDNAAVIWRAYTSPRPLMTLVNGKCRGTGCGLALAAKYAGLQDASEFIVDGPNVGLTPYSGMTRLLARPETSLKYPGLAEFVMLTGTSLFAGDALRLGWSDLFTTLPDMAYHIKSWFDSTEHMHNDAVAWQLGHLLEKCFHMKDGAHSSAMERCAMTPCRARWVEDAFADQPSIEAILATLSAMEKLPLTDRHNTADPSYATPYTLASVAAGVEKLSATRLRYTLSPWDVTPPEEEVEVRQAAEIFTSYVLERRGKAEVVTHRDRHKAQAWREQREREYAAHSNLRNAPHHRHVYARLEGCEGTLVDFDFTVDPVGDAAAAAAATTTTTTPAGAIHATDLPTSSLDRLKRAVLHAMGMPADRDVDLCWYLPTLDTCPVRSDAELVDVLHCDPGLEDPTAQLRYPPIYFLVKRNSLHLSEWAYAVKHQLLLQSPFALKATLQMLHEIRGDGSAEAVRSLADTLAVEYRYATRLLMRHDFHQVGQHVDKSAEEWDSIKEERERHVHKAHLPTRPLPDYESVFERNVELDGHTFQLRPRWSPRTVQEVSADALVPLAAPLDFGKDGTAELNVIVHAGKSERLAGMIDDAGGVEVVVGLGELDKDGAATVPPLQGDAHVPTNVNFYEMARHPWEDTPSSWRRDGFTAGSKEYFEQQYRKAEKAVYDEAGRGQRNYWPSKDAVDGVTGEESNALLEERFFAKLRDAERGVESWARQLRKKALDGALDNKSEIATQQEKIYDDEYYRWFIQPGHNPNPSGLVRGRRGGGNDGGSGAVDRDLEVFLNQLLSGAAASEAGAGDAAAMDESQEGFVAPDVVDEATYAAEETE